jgi:hypothetical protein
MRYRPVKVLNIRTVEFRTITGLEISTGHTQNFWQVRSERLGNCGHKHRTEKACKRCLERMKRDWSRIRSRTSRDATAQRKAEAFQSALCDHCKHPVHEGGCWEFENNAGDMDSCPCGWN